MTTKPSAGLFPHLYPVSASQRNNIKAGKYINLASLLITPIDSNEVSQTDPDGTVTTIKIKDSRLQRDLSINEFIGGFNIYKKGAIGVLNLTITCKI